MVILNHGDVNKDNVTPPKQNQVMLVPLTRMVHNLDDMDDLSSVVFIDHNVVDLIFKKLGPPTPVRKEVRLHLIGYGTSFDVSIWVVPFFSEGVLVHLLFAADDANQSILQQYRNPVKPANYDITCPSL